VFLKSLPKDFGFMRLPEGYEVSGTENHQPDGFKILGIMLVKLSIENVI